MKTSKIKAAFTSRLQPSIKEDLIAAVESAGVSIEDALEEAILSWMGNEAADSSPLKRLSRNEQSLLEGVIIGIRAKDRQMLSMVEAIKVLIEEKGYEYKQQDAEGRSTNRRGKIA